MPLKALGERPYLNLNVPKGIAATRGEEERLVIGGIVTFFYISLAVVYLALLIWWAKADLLDSCREIRSDWGKWGKVKPTEPGHMPFTRVDRAYKGPFPKTQRFLNLFFLRPIAFFFGVILMLLVAPFLNLRYNVRKFRKNQRSKAERLRREKEERETLKLAWNYVQGVLVVCTDEAYMRGWNRLQEAIRAGYADEGERVHAKPVCLFHHKDVFPVGEEEMKRFFCGTTEEFDIYYDELLHSGRKIRKIQRSELYVPFANMERRKYDLTNSHATLDPLVIFGAKE